MPPAGPATERRRAGTAERESKEESERGETLGPLVRAAAAVRRGSFDVVACAPLSLLTAKRRRTCARSRVRVLLYAPMDPRRPRTARQRACAPLQWAQPAECVRARGKDHTDECRLLSLTELESSMTPRATETG